MFVLFFDFFNGLKGEQRNVSAAVSADINGSKSSKPVGAAPEAGQTLGITNAWPHSGHLPVCPPTRPSPENSCRNHK